MCNCNNKSSLNGNFTVLWMWGKFIFFFTRNNCIGTFWNFLTQAGCFHKLMYMQMEIRKRMSKWFLYVKVNMNFHSFNFYNFVHKWICLTVIMNCAQLIVAFLKFVKTYFSFSGECVSEKDAYVCGSSSSLIKYVWFYFKFLTLIVNYFKASNFIVLFNCQ